jgi:hypothetical protein
MSAKSTGMSVKDIADATGTSGKTLRAYLRRNHSRSTEVKGSRWGDAKNGYTLSATLTAELLERFTPKEEAAE